MMGILDIDPRRNYKLVRWHNHSFVRSFAKKNGSLVYLRGSVARAYCKASIMLQRAECAMYKAKFGCSLFVKAQQLNFLRMRASILLR